ncbi:MAG: hypothetical protein LC774_02010 [Acidobacteria bacterium]|nr:hypothetical protein [Acidobacteriota bacterium]
MAGSEDLERSLRRAVDEHVGARLREHQEEIQRAQAQIAETLSALAERLAGEGGGGAASLQAAISAHLRNARNVGADEASRSSAGAGSSGDVALLKAAVDDIDSQRTQADILHALVNRAAAFAPRIAFFVVKNERATGWRARGLEGTVGDDAVREISLPLEADTILGEVYRTRAAWSGAPGSKAEDHQLLSKLGDEPPHRMVAIPLVARDKCVAVLYADSAGLDGEAINLEALETVVRVTGMAVELLAVKRGAPAQPSASAAAPQPSRPAAATETQDAPVEVEPEQAREAAPAAATSEPRREPGAATSAPEVSSPPAGIIPPPAEVSAPAPESPDAQGAGTHAAPLGASRRYGQDADLPVEVPEEERRLHNDARRFARLLVSEIKLYNEQKVTDGRTEGNLYDRLREEIDRSRQMYDKRVHPSVSPRFDYFHQELVNTLAGGDASKLGAGYPGATVAA